MVGSRPRKRDRVAFLLQYRDVLAATLGDAAKYMTVLDRLLENQRNGKPQNAATAAGTLGLVDPDSRAAIDVLSPPEEATATAAYMRSVLAGRRYWAEEGNDPFGERVEHALRNVRGAPEALQEVRDLAGWMQAYHSTGVDELRKEVRQVEDTCKEWQAKYEAAAAALLGSQAQLEGIHAATRPVPKDAGYWPDALEDFLQLAKEDGQYKATTLRCTRSYLEPWVKHLAANAATPSSALLAAYLNRKLAASSKLRIAKSIIHFCSVAQPGLQMTFKLAVQAKDKKAKQEVTDAVMERLRELTIRALYGAPYADRVLAAAKAGLLLPSRE